MHTFSPCLNLVVLRSADIDRAATFHREIGLSLSRHAHGTGPEHYSAEAEGAVFEIYPLTPKSKPTVGTRIGFRVNSVDALVPLLARQGAKVIVAPANSEWGRRAVVKDLDGHSVELLTPNFPTSNAG